MRDYLGQRLMVQIWAGVWSENPMQEGGVHQCLNDYYHYYYYSTNITTTTTTTTTNIFMSLALPPPGSLGSPPPGMWRWWAHMSSACWLNLFLPWFMIPCSDVSSQSLSYHVPPDLCLYYKSIPTSCHGQCWQVHHVILTWPQNTSMSNMNHIPPEYDVMYGVLQIVLRRPWNIRRP